MRFDGCDPSVIRTLTNRAAGDRAYPMKDWRGCRRVAVATLGCKVNQCDTQTLREGLAARGCQETADPHEAHLLIVNTCCVTHHADRKSRQAVRQAARLKREGACLAAVGCYPGYDRQALAAIAGVDGVFSIAERPAFWSWVDGPLDVTRCAGQDGRFIGRTRAFLKIQEGCDNNCSYCVVPLVRGPSRSLPFDEVVAAGRRLVAAGHKEIVLTGVNLGAYRTSANGKVGLTGFIDALEGLPGLVRLRLSSIEAQDVTQDLIDRMAASSKLCPHLHIPFQSGDDGILEHMGKRLRVADYLDIIGRCRRAVPDLAVTCDVIVGYPVETAGSHLNTCRFLEEVEPLRTHLFTFSPRRGTRLAVTGIRFFDPRVVRERRLELEELTHRLSLRCKRRFLGKRMDVLVEEKNGQDCAGYTPNYMRIFFKSGTCRVGEIHPIIFNQKELTKNPADGILA